MKMREIPLRKISSILIVLFTFGASVDLNGKSLESIYKSKSVPNSKIEKKHTSSLNDIYSKSAIRSKVSDSRKNYRDSARENARVFGGEKIEKNKKIRIGDILEIILEQTNKKSEDDNPVHTNTSKRGIIL